MKELEFNFKIWGTRFYEHYKEKAINDYVHNFPIFYNYLQQNKFISQEYSPFSTSKSHVLEGAVLCTLNKTFLFQNSPLEVISVIINVTAVSQLYRSSYNPRACKFYYFNIRLDEISARSRHVD
jgi:hypothetical protein